ncbi:MAG: DUF2797 domain-containing protein [Flavobacteriaceae bacterium]|nr:DUF2797 domain-containing protein [Flavobacteriaceae bacterium]
MFEARIIKMYTEWQQDQKVQYFLKGSEDFLHINQLLEKAIHIEFLNYQCMGCDMDKKIFAQGYCYDCFERLPQTGEWVMHPEKSKAHLGEEDRNLIFEQKVQLKPHVVYLANSSNVKVGVTRKSQLPTRWIDQGAHEAIVLAETENRYQAGCIEVALKEHISDKTNWRTMLKNEVMDEDLKAVKAQLINYIPDEFKAFVVEDSDEVNIQFPVKQYPMKLNTLKLENTPSISGKLLGIKGQYLLFDGGRVFNVRSHEGYVVRISIVLEKIH